MTEQPTPVAGIAAELVERMKGGIVQGPRPVAFDRDELAEDMRAMTHQLRDQRWEAVAPVRFRGAQLADVDEHHAAVLARWASTLEENLVLFGPVGTGKTHAALAAVREPVRATVTCRFLPVVELLDMLRPGGPDGALQELCRVDLLVLDDLGHERPTDWTVERLGAVVNRRWLEQLPIVATTNLEPPQLREAVGERTFSRLMGDATVVKLTGTDRRRARSKR